MNYDRVPVSPNNVAQLLAVGNDEIQIDKLYANLAVPSYVHAYSLAIDYMYNWFQSKFGKDFFVGGIYVDGKHVLDDYKNKYYKYIIKGQQPRARIEPRIQYDYDREGLDSYLAPIEMFARKTTYDTSFFKDYDRKLFLGINLKALRMDFNFKVRLNTRAQQLDIAQKMELAFRVGSTQAEDLSVDFHIPKELILNIAETAGFEIKHGEVVDIIDFLTYLNSHSELPFLFKIRAINQKAEFFIRLNGLYTHIAVRDKLSLDDGERNGKLDYHFHIEMNAQLTIPVPQFYTYYACSDSIAELNLKESNEGTIAIYSINTYEIPKVDENGWIQAAVTDYMTDKGDTEMDLSSLFTGENILSRTINHDLVKGLNPSHFINIKVFRQEDIETMVDIRMDWKTRIAYFKEPQIDDVLHIAVYYDRDYINELNIAQQGLQDSRYSKSDLDKSKGLPDQVPLDHRPLN